MRFLQSCMTFFYLFLSAYFLWWLLGFFPMLWFLSGVLAWGYLCRNTPQEESKDDSWYDDYADSQWVENELDERGH